MHRISKENDNQVVDLKPGKRSNKEDLCERFDLDAQKPLFAFIGRLVYEKGADLLPGIVYSSLLKGVSGFLVLGSGNREVESELKTLRVHFRGSYGAFVGYDEELAHRIYAGADFLLMPSRVEPCGLNQMYAMRYGTIPVVCRTGGLKDTVVDVRNGGNGICFEQPTVQDSCHAIDRAVALYHDEKELERIRKKCMQIDHAWAKSAKEYLSLYKSLTH